MMISIVGGAPGDRRMALFTQALHNLNITSGIVLSYSDYLRHAQGFEVAFKHNPIVRIESPGKDFEINRLILAEGFNSARKESVACLSETALQKLTEERGIFLPARQWYLGFCHILDRIKKDCRSIPSSHFMNHPDDIKLMFDKVACIQYLDDNGIKTPNNLGVITDFNHLCHQMETKRCNRVFIKLAHGSSGIGTIAYQTDGRRHHAVTTFEQVIMDGHPRLYNTRKLITLTDRQQIAELVNTICKHRAFAEAWIPKAGFNNMTFDLRVVVIDGQAQHSIVRLSKSPLTNLHLLNQRAPIESILHLIGEEGWENIKATCEGIMNLFPESLYAGIDIAVHSDYRHHTVLEVNAFGDLLPGVTIDGMDTYTMELKAMLKRTV